MRKRSIKNTRVNTEVQRELSNIIRGGIKDPRVAPWPSVVAVELSLIHICIKEIIADREGISQLHTIDPYAKTAGETIAWQSGIQVEDCEEKGNGLSAVNNRKVTGINPGDWAAVAGADFGMEGAASFTAKVDVYKRQL